MQGVFSPQPRYALLVHDRVGGRVGSRRNPPTMLLKQIFIIERKEVRNWKKQRKGQLLGLLSSSVLFF